MPKERLPYYFFAMAVLAAFAFSFSVDLPKRQGGFKSDESTYFSITQSLAYDQDLRYEPRDLKRIYSRFQNGPMGIFLKKNPDGSVFYAKSFAYPLWAALFFRIFDTNGLLLFNALMLIACLLMSYLMLRLYNSVSFSLGLSLIFTGASVVPVYLWWLTADLFNYFSCFAGLFFFFYPFKRPVWHVLSAFFFAFAVFSKPSSALPLAIVALILLIKKDFKRFMAMAICGTLTLGALVLFNYQQSGSIQFMGGDRRSFHYEYPFQKPSITFDNAQSSVKMSSDNFWQRYHISPRVVGTNLFYFSFGRFSGLFIYYFFAVFALIIFFFRKKTLPEWFVFSAIASGILFFITVTSDNYFGGSGTIGNRYFMTLYPLFFFLIYKVKINTKHLLIPTAAGLVFVLPILMDSMHLSATPRYAAINGFARFFPAEKTLYQSLPTNENFRAFGPRLGVYPNRFQIYFLNDNFRAISGDTFWTQANPEHSLEAFLVTKQVVKTWSICISNIPLDNEVTVKLEDQVYHLSMRALAQQTLEISPVTTPLMVDNSFIYHLTISSAGTFTPYLADTNNEDKSHRGVGIILTIKN